MLGLFLQMHVIHLQGNAELEVVIFLSYPVSQHCTRSVADQGQVRLAVDVHAPVFYTKQIVLFLDKVK